MENDAKVLKFMLSDYDSCGYFTNGKDYIAKKSIGSLFIVKDDVGCTRYVSLNDICPHATKKDQYRFRNKGNSNSFFKEVLN